MARKWLFQLIGVLVFVFILFRIDFRTLSEVISNARPVFLIPAVALTVPFVVFKTVRWQSLLSMQGIDYGFRNSFLAYMGSMYLGLVTPGRLGDFAKVLYLRKDRGITVGKGFSSVFVDRLFDLLILVSMACAGGVAFALSLDMLTVIFSFVALFVLIVLVFLNERSGKRAVRFLYRLILPKKYIGSTDEQFDAFYEGIREFKRVGIVAPLTLSLLSYLFFYIQCYLIAVSLNIGISFMDTAFCITTANLISLLPITISGIGTRDATLITLFAVIGLSKEAALSFSIVFLFISNITAALIGAVAWFRKPIDIKR